MLQVMFTQKEGKTKEAKFWREGDRTIELAGKDKEERETRQTNK